MRKGGKRLEVSLKIEELKERLEASLLLVPPTVVMCCVCLEDRSPSSGFVCELPPCTTFCCFACARRTTFRLKCLGCTLVQPFRARNLKNLENFCRTGDWETKSLHIQLCSTMMHAGGIIDEFENGEYVEDICRGAKALVLLMPVYRKQLSDLMDKFEDAYACVGAAEEDIPLYDFGLNDDASSSLSRMSDDQLWSFALAVSKGECSPWVFHLPDLVGAQNLHMGDNDCVRYSWNELICFNLENKN